MITYSRINSHLPMIKLFSRISFIINFKRCALALFSHSSTRIKTLLDNKNFNNEDNGNNIIFSPNQSKARTHVCVCLILCN